jgi:16S rRNA (cytidine1402-2'-O)-methyltransferase
MLYLLPNLLDENSAHELFLPISVDKVVAKLDGLVAESEKGGRHFLRRFAFPEPKTFRDMPIRLLNEHSTEKDLDELMEPLKKRENWGLISDCGLPCLADPGSKLVRRCHALNIPVEALVGPSSIVMALMLSGLPAQSFAFHGYLERETPLLAKQLQLLEERSLKEKSTHVCIEAPYRSPRMLETLIHNLKDTTLLCVAWDLALPTQRVIVLSVSRWKKFTLPNLEKKPCVFLFASASN